MPVEAALGLLVHRGCRFIKEDPAGTLRENARKSELLLLTQREDMAPVAFLSSSGIRWESPEKAKSASHSFRESLISGYEAASASVPIGM